jgi:hypothetical protein
MLGLATNQRNATKTTTRCFSTNNLIKLFKHFHNYHWQGFGETDTSNLDVLSYKFIWLWGGHFGNFNQNFKCACILTNNSISRNLSYHNMQTNV